MFRRPLVCGVDEAGRGPLAGPVVAAAVILPADFDTAGIDDSKLLSARQREIQRDRILESSALWGIGIVGPGLIDQKNILQASLLAMQAAVEALRVEPDLILVDGCHLIPGLAIKQYAIVGGDRTEPLVAAASILAKTQRDEIMTEFDERYPGYGFGRHKGYPTPQHIYNLSLLGPSPIHRRSFRPVCEYIRR